MTEVSEVTTIEQAPLSHRLRGPVNIEDAEAIDAADHKARLLDEQIGRLADFIMAEVPGEPSQSQGAVDTAIRWMRAALAARAIANARVEKLEKALKPFAQAVDRADTRADEAGFARSFDEYVCAWDFSFGDLRNARAALEPPHEAP